VKRSSKVSIGTSVMPRKAETNPSVSSACAPPLASERHGEPDDDPVDLFALDHFHELLETCGGRNVLDDIERPRQGCGRIRYGDAGPRRAVVESEDFHRRASLVPLPAMLPRFSVASSKPC